MLLVLLLWCAGLGAAAQFGKISILYEPLRSTYGGHGEVALGLVVSIVGMVGLIFGTTAGLLVARVGPRRAIVTALVAGAAMSALQSLFPAYPLMLASRIIEGASHLAIVVVGPTMIAALAPEAKRPLAMTLWSSFFGVTYAILALIGPLVTPVGLFLGHAGFMAALAALLAVTLPPDPKAAPAPMANLLGQHVEIYASPRLAAPAMGFCCYTFLYVAILTLLPPETPVTHRALIAAGMPIASIVVSLTLGVRLLRRVSAVRLVQYGYAAAIPGFLLLWGFWGHGAGMVLAGFWLSAALGIVQGASFASIPELNATPEGRARAAGAVAQLGNLGTTTGTPVLAALLAASGPPGLTAAACLLCLAGIYVHQLQSRRRARVG
ncbi:MAG: MFS transporter [Tabrizicola sp.]|uniref:MFS transporter n=1 Tax=Tabrizicola sp. TaxID=2005166 RepID=UPI002733C74C|nr:MFS transporter [Tabrizicola sp.]MDP3263424.1 MFS transporter [Tabrizicola sp.]MDP3646781.1 MFS transporter [Paracoccaceae bacterium]MDZ4067470.1 MFS transporter [Tabrizicola sp.]